MDRNDLNKRLKRTNIKGRGYIEVNQRILAFWELYPNGRIITEKLSDDGKRCDFKASVFNGDNLLATGHAFEFQSAGLVNKTSYVENAETSAVGRALGILGIGITESIASADEVQSAIAHQEKGEEPVISPKSQEPDPNPELHEAQQILLDAERKYCKARGIKDLGTFHRETVMKREDYANETDTLKAIALEIAQAAESEQL